MVTDLREQGFDLDDLVNGLLSYREAEPGAEICIVGCISDYTGELSVPAYSNSNAGADIASIDNYDGPAAYYYIMAGPTEQMDQYIGMLQDNMQDENLVYATFEELAASEGKPLSFSLVKNTMEGKRTDDLQPGNVSDNGKTTPETAQAEELPASSPPAPEKEPMVRQQKRRILQAYSCWRQRRQQVRQERRRQSFFAPRIVSET